jgi:hypothetical protein
MKKLNQSLKDKLGSKPDFRTVKRIYNGMEHRELMPEVKQSVEAKIHPGEKAMLMMALGKKTAEGLDPHF